MVLAFSTDPFVRWLFPEPAKFLSYFTEITRIHGERTAAYGGAYGLTDGRGAAFWYPPGTHSDGDALGAVLKKAGVMERLSQVLEGVSEYEPNEPHWYLRQIGIDPVLQRKGQGARLLEAGLADVRSRGDLAYLEATSVTSRKILRTLWFLCSRRSSGVGFGSLMADVPRAQVGAARRGSPCGISAAPWVAVPMWVARGPTPRSPMPYWYPWGTKAQREQAFGISYSIEMTPSFDVGQHHL